MVCITKNEDGSACHNCHRLSLQSCNYGNGVYCAIHHKKNINFGHDPNLSSCANVRCDELKIDYEDRKKIHQYNIDEILCLPGHDIYCHVSKSRQRIFNWNVIPEIDRYSQSVEASNTEETNSESESDNDFVNPDSDSTESDESTSKEGEEESSSEPILLKIEIDLTNNNRKRKHVQINLQPMKKSRYGQQNINK
jgi:hypothetical protein